MNPELENRLQEEIAQSGFPVELDAVSDLREAGYLVYPNLSFRSRERTANEIDAVALSSVKDSAEWPFGNVGDILVVECKRQKDKPWAFFEEVLDPLAVLGLVREVEILTELEYFRPHSVLSACMNSPLGGHHFNTHIPTARTYFEAFRKPSQETIIFKAVQSVWHALTFIRSWFEEQGSRGSGTGR